MGRWTDLQKEMNGHKRKLANRKYEVSLKTAPWEKKDEEDDGREGEEVRRVRQVAQPAKLSAPSLASAAKTEESAKS